MSVKSSVKYAANNSANIYARSASFILGVLISLSFAQVSSASSGAVKGTVLCGLFQREDFRPTVLTSLIDFTTYPGMAKAYTITNANSALVSGLVTGQCYCLVGDAIVDPAYSGDSLFQLLKVSDFVRGPYAGCTQGYVIEP